MYPFQSEATLQLVTLVRRDIEIALVAAVLLLLYCACLALTNGEKLNYGRLQC